MHAFRATERLADNEGAWDRGRYIASLIVTTTVLGALSLQLKNLAAGKDPEPMYGEHGAKFWMNAAGQGGGLGILGDQLKAMFSAKRIDDPSRLVPPVTGLSLDLMGLTMGNIQDSIAGRESHIGRDLVRFWARLDK